MHDRLNLDWEEVYFYADPECRRNQPSFGRADVPLQPAALIHFRSFRQLNKISVLPSLASPLSPSFIVCSVHFSSRFLSCFPPNATSVLYTVLISGCATRCARDTHTYTMVAGGGSMGKGLSAQAQWSGTPSVKGSSEAMKMALLTLSLVGLQYAYRGCTQPRARADLIAGSHGILR
jgi:hypothetical protein